MLLLAMLLLQDGEVDRLLAGHDQKMRLARTPGDARRVLAETREKLDAFAKAHPKHADAPRAAWHAAESLLATGETDPALERLRALIKDHPDATSTTNARFAVAEALIDKEDWAGARAAADEFLKKHPKDERAFFAKALTASAFAGEGDYDKAADTLRAARDAHKDKPESWGALLQIAVFRHAQGKPDAARAALDEVIQSCPDRDTQDVARLHLSAYLKMGEERPAVAGTEGLAGKVGVLYFFDSTYAPAVGELRALRKLRAAIPDLALAGVSMDLDKKDLASFTTEEKPDWPILHDGKGYDGAAARAFDVRRLPSLWVVDRKGRLRYHNLAGQDLKRAISGLLQEK